MTEKWSPLTEEERARMRESDDYSDAAIVRRAGGLIESLGHEKAFEMATSHRAGFPTCAAGYTFWTRVAERIRAVPDWSDAAIERRAAEMVARWGVDTAYDHAEAHQARYANGEPGASFWSRVIVRILTTRIVPEQDDVVAASSEQETKVGGNEKREPSATVGGNPEPASIAPAEHPRTAASRSSSSQQGPFDLSSHTTQEYASNPERPLRWFEERGVSAAPPTSPSPKLKPNSDEPEQGRLF